MRTSELLSAALDHLGPSGERWVKRAADTADAACSVGAVAWIIFENNLSWDVSCPALRLLADEIGVSGDVNYVACHIGSWNDNPHTTWEDVQLMFKRAIAAAEEAEAA